MPSEQVHLVVRKPLSDIEEDIRRKFGLTTALSEVSIEKDALVFTFEGGPNESKPPKPVLSNGEGAGSHLSPPRRRRKRRIRNRMKTGGWDVVAKFTNSRGQPCTIYRPIFDALTSRKLTRREAYAITRDALVSKGNSPKPSSVEYFLNNTLEYIGSKELIARKSPTSE